MRNIGWKLFIDFANCQVIMHCITGRVDGIFFFFYNIIISCQQELLWAQLYDWLGLVEMAIQEEYVLHKKYSPWPLKGILLVVIVIENFPYNSSVYTSYYTSRLLWRELVSVTCEKIFGNTNVFKIPLYVQVCMYIYICSIAQCNNLHDFPD